MFLAVVIGGLINIKALLFLVPVDFTTFRNKVEDFLADTYSKTVGNKFSFECF